MRILILSTNFHPVIGGAESYCRDLATGLARRGHGVTVFTDGGSSGAPSGRVEHGVRVVRDRSHRQDVTSADGAAAWSRCRSGCCRQSPTRCAWIPLR